MRQLRYRSNRRPVAIVLWCCLVIAGGPALFAQNVEDFADRLTRFTLDNGLTFLVLERHEAPVASFQIYADVGAVNEVVGITGIAHMLEHLAFKGTRTVGTTNWEAEAEAMAEADAVFEKIKAVREEAGPETHQLRLKELQQQLDEAQKKASQYIVHDRFEEIYNQAGGTGLNASTSWDATRYIISLPSNKLELWMWMESDRFLYPVFREFYKERNVIMEERRLRTESDPVGRLLEDFMAVAYKAHPYGYPVIGYMSDIETITREEVRDFFRIYYSPANLTIAIVGDVDPQQIRQMAEIYFGRIPTLPEPTGVETIEPPQLGPRRVELHDPAQPFVLIGYHKPSIHHKDNAVFDAITDIVGMGRTSRLYESLVKEKRIAVYASGFQGLPGNKFPGLFLFYAVPAKGHTNEESEQAIYAEIERLKTESVSPEELEKARTRARASLIRSLASNSGMASQLAFYEAVTGDWRNLFEALKDIERVTAEDIQRVAKEYFKPTNRTVGVIQTTAPAN